MPRTASIDLWGNTEDVFVTAKERYGIWPTTVWPCDMSNKTTQQLKRAIGDDGGERHESFTKTSHDKSIYRGKVTESIFNPAVAMWAMNCWANEGDVVYDPFAGGGTRATIAASIGHQYIGVELRGNEVAAIMARVRANEYTGITIYTGDARVADTFIEPDTADFLITCPPYWSLEKYNGGVDDLSMAPTIDEFEEGIYDTAFSARSITKPGALAFWVVGLMRDPGGALIPLHHIVTRAHQRAGWTLLEEVVLHQINNGALQRVGQFEKGQHHLVRIHEYGLLFRNDYNTVAEFRGDA